MKIPNREINIFNLSMLDIICGALGAFLIVTIILIPSYQNQARIKVEDVTEKKKQNVRLEEEIEKLKARNRDNDRLEKMRDANEEMRRKLVLRKRELERLQQHAQDLGPSPPMYIFVYWWWESAPEREQGSNGLIKVDLNLTARPPGRVIIAPTENPAPAFGPDPPGAGSNRTGRGGTFFVIRNPAAFEEFDVRYVVSPHVPPRLFVGGYVQHGEQIVSLEEVFLEPPGPARAWQHFHGTLKFSPPASRGEKAPVVSFELSEAGRKYDEAAARWDREARSRADYGVSEEQRLERDRKIREIMQRRQKERRNREAQARQRRTEPPAAAEAVDE